MRATTVLPPARLPRRTAAVADLYLRAPRLHVNSACMANPAAPKKPKRPSSDRGGEPPAKRVRRVGEPHLAAAAKDPKSSTRIDTSMIKKLPCPSSHKDSTSSTRLDASMIKKQSVHSPIRLPETTAQPKPSISMRDLIEKARQAKERPAAEKALEIERRRTDARQKVEQIVATVEFNDPFIDPADVFMSRQQLAAARDAAARDQARIIERARQRETEALK